MGGNPLTCIKEAEQVEQNNSAEQYEQKVAKVNAELANLDAYKGELANLAEQKREVEDALATKDNPRIEAERENLVQYLAELKKTIDPIQEKVSFLNTIKTWREGQAWADMAQKKVDEIIKELTPVLKDDFMLAKSTFYQIWYDVRNANQQELKEGRFQVQDRFPLTVHGGDLKFGWNHKYPDQMFRVSNHVETGKNVEIGKKYPWKEAMAITKKYYAEDKEKLGKAIEAKIKESTF